MDAKESLYVWNTKKLTGTVSQINLDKNSCFISKSPTSGISPIVADVGMETCRWLRNLFTWTKHLGSAKVVSLIWSECNLIVRNILNV